MPLYHYQHSASLDSSIHHKAAPAIQVSRTRLVVPLLTGHLTKREARMRVVLLLVAALFSQVATTTVEEVQAQIDQLKAAIQKITYEVMSDQFKDEEATRNSGASGLKIMRGDLVRGTKSYLATSYSGVPVAGLHDHGNNIRTVGMGELVAVLNGVEFRTRHNDYIIVMKSETSGEMGAVQHIDFPEVPPAVLEKTNVSEQVVEMREWFKAWKDQDHATRDYRPYFKPILCYLEGVWTMASENISQNFFFSDRHNLNATTWKEMEEKIRFSSDTGREDELQNFAYLPKKIVGADENGAPIVSQYNYRILCHPLKDDLPLDRLRVTDDIKSRMKLSVDLGKPATLEDLSRSRLARYQLNTRNVSTWEEESNKKYTLLDTFMYEIPGMDNYGGEVYDDAFGLRAKQYLDSTLDLNAANYHRVLRLNNIGALGTNFRARAFNDPNLYMAMNTQPEVADTAFGSWSQKWSYAIPLEIIYLTPLPKWNPYGIVYKGVHGSDGALSAVKDVDGNRRTGENNVTLAYNGTTSKLYFFTPIEFYNELSNDGADAADTTGTSHFVLDAQGTMREVAATGNRIFLPDIPGGVGSLRQRYPILPLYEEGNPTWQEMEALKDITLAPSDYSCMSREYVPDDSAVSSTYCIPLDGPISVANLEDVAVANMETAMNLGNFSDVGLIMVSLVGDAADTHQVELTADDMETLCNDDRVTLTTAAAADGHVHLVEVKRYIGLISGTNTYRIKYILNKCDGYTDCNISVAHDRRIYFLPPV